MWKCPNLTRYPPIDYEMGRFGLMQRAQASSLAAAVGSELAARWRLDARPLLSSGHMHRPQRLDPISSRLWQKKKFTNSGKDFSNNATEITRETKQCHFPPSLFGGSLRRKKKKTKPPQLCPQRELRRNVLTTSLTRFHLVASVCCC